jgi:hypothetical protein
LIYFIFRKGREDGDGKIDNTVLKDKGPGTVVKLSDRGVLMDKYVRGK